MWRTDDEHGRNAHLLWRGNKSDDEIDKEAEKGLKSWVPKSKVRGRLLHYRGDGGVGVAQGERKSPGEGMAEDQEPEKGELDSSASKEGVPKLVNRQDSEIGRDKRASANRVCVCSLSLHNPASLNSTIDARFVIFFLLYLHVYHAQMHIYFVTLFSLVSRYSAQDWVKRRLLSHITARKWRFAPRKMWWRRGIAMDDGIKIIYLYEFVICVIIAGRSRGGNQTHSITSRFANFQYHLNATIGVRERVILWARAPVFVEVFVP